METEIKTLVCGKCHETKNIDQFAVDNSKKSGRQSLCRSCKHSKASAVSNADSTPNGQMSFSEWSHGVPREQAKTLRGFYEMLARERKLLPPAEFQTPEQREFATRENAVWAARKAVAEAGRLASIEFERVNGPCGLPDYEETTKYIARRKAAIAAAQEAARNPA